MGLAAAFAFTSVAAAPPSCGGRPVRSIEFSGRECTAICRVLRKEILFVGDRILFGASGIKEGVALVANGQTDLQKDELNIPQLPSGEFPGGLNVGRASSRIAPPEISLSVNRQVLSSSGEVLADYRENVSIRFEDHCEACEVVQYQFNLVGKGRRVISDFHAYSCRVAY